MQIVSLQQSWPIAKVSLIFTIILFIVLMIVYNLVHHANNAIKTIKS